MPVPLGHRPLVFNVGNDSTLLAYRAEVLKLAGFQVLSISPPVWSHQEQFAHLCRMQKPEISIACHTLTRSQRLALAKQLRSDCPEMKLLALTTDDLDREEERLYDALIDSLDGPAALIDTLRRQL
jgi:DNA-binding NarL/FixJ family response regulator